MLNKIEITNFQSHKNTSLTLDRGINAITGVSDSGKSSVQRAINWVLANRPSGNAFQSHWAAKNGTTVTLDFDGVKVSRHKSKSKNSYQIGNNEFNVVGTDVPSEVQEFINLDAINIQGQHDRYFLMQDTSGEVARKLNKIANLEIIDFVLSSTDSAIRENNKEIAVTEKSISNTQESLKQYTHLDIVEKLITELLLDSTQKEVLDKDIQTITTIMEIIETTQEDLDILTEWLGIEKELAPLLKLMTELNELSDNGIKLEILIKSITTIEEDIQSLTKEIDREKDVDTLLKDLALFKNTRTELSSLQTIVGSIEALQKAIQTLSDQAGCEVAINALLTDIDKYKTNMVDLRGVTKLILNISITADGIEEQDERIAKNIELATELITKNKMCPLCGGKITKDALAHVMEWL
jgi:DNA repair protein SbcC/Rad50